MRHKALLVHLLLAATAVGFAVSLPTRGDEGTPPRNGPQASVPLVQSDSQRVFSLIDQYGRPITNDTFRGEWVLVFFGFTHCSDSCPTTLIQLSKSLEKLEGQARNVRVLFITLDPERDTPEILEAYLRPFGPRFVGATGSVRQIEAATSTFRAYSRKRPNSPDGSYSVDHSTQIYVLNPNGLLSRQLSSQATADQLAPTLRTLIDRGS